MRRRSIAKVTDHAVVCWLERVAGFDIAALRAQIAGSAEIGIAHGAKAVVVAGGKLILGSTRGELVFVSPTDGSVSSTIELKAPISLQPVVANHMLYILDDKGRLTAFR